MENERGESLIDALIILCIELRSLDGPVIRTDPAPGFLSLVNDEVLYKYRIALGIRRAKNPNKNPVDEKAVRELADELINHRVVLLLY